MNETVQSILDTALSQDPNSREETGTHSDTVTPFFEEDTVKLAHALEYLSTNLDVIGTEAEKLADLNALQEKVSNALAVIPPPTPTSPLDQAKAFKAGQQSGQQSAGVAQAVKNTWKGTGPKWTSAMGGHAGKAALITGGLLGAGLAGKALFDKEGSYNGYSVEDLAEYLDKTEDDLYVLNKVAGLRGSTLHEELVKQAAGLDSIKGMIHHLATGDQTGRPLSEQNIKLLKKRLASALAENPALANDPAYKTLSAQIDGFKPGQVISAADEAVTNKAMDPKERAKSGSGAQQRAQQPKANPTTTATPTPKANPTATPTPTKATSATSAVKPSIFKNPKLYGGLAAAAGLGLAAKAAFGGQDKSASYEETDMSVFGDYDFSYLMTKEAAEVPKSIQDANSRFIRGIMAQMSPEELRELYGSNATKVPERFHTQNNMTADQQRADAARRRGRAKASPRGNAGSSARQLVRTGGNDLVTQRGSTEMVRYQAPKTRKARVRAASGANAASNKALYKNPYLLGGLGLAAAGGAYAYSKRKNRG